ncbi:PREDICTED: RING-H2 finger protein ATL22-like [Tarenaya hassleriana]|uniref:RING-H2 finger protein ATL22-like n=1 Tax=Tarenaya hassleriana TaxID=28532 RepID=UPI00053C2B69|nr:PREDICTED: RING-H2 finger protein ATL22-like [Tarenaya hassleriana]
MNYLWLLSSLATVMIYTCCYCLYYACTHRADEADGSDIESDESDNDIEMALPLTLSIRLAPVSCPEVITPRMVHEFRDVVGGEGGEANTCCPICLEVYVPEDKVVCLSKCRHLFHPACIERWVLKNLSCPICRSPASGKGWCVMKKDVATDGSTVQGVMAENTVVVEDVAERDMDQNLVVEDVAEQVGALA